MGSPSLKHIFIFARIVRMCIYIYIYDYIRIDGFYPGACSLARLGTKIRSPKYFFYRLTAPLIQSAKMTDCSNFTHAALNTFSIHQSLESCALQCLGVIKEEKDEALSLCTTQI